MASILRQALSLEIQRTTAGVHPGGAPVEQTLVLRNRSADSASITIWIQANDQRSKDLESWYLLSERMPLVLSPHQNKEISLSFEVPSQAEPGLYSYDILLQAEQFGEDTLRRPQQIRILPPVQNIEFQDEPDFVLTPPTHSEQPYQLQPGLPLSVTVQVKNSSRQVDRFFLKCPELDPTWFTIEYPETNLDAPGLLSRTDGLQLNPNDTGEIVLQLHPPKITPAGFYSSTLRLKSANRDDLVLLNILYLQVLVDESLELQLQPESRIIPSLQETFQLDLVNSGNVERQIEILATDDADLFSYEIEPETVILSPGLKTEIIIHPLPKRSWRRNWRGATQDVPFTVMLADLQPVDDTPEPVKLPTAQGVVCWQSRSQWLRWLLMFLLGALLAAGLLGLAYWLLRELVVKPSLEPSIYDFSSTQTTYPVSNGNPTRLNWSIHNPKPDNQAVITYYAATGETLFSQAYTIGNLGQNKACKTTRHRPHSTVKLLRQIYGHPIEQPLLTCIGLSVPLSGDQATLTPGQYQVTLELFDANNANQAIESKRLSQLQITPPPPADIATFSAQAPVYRWPVAQGSNQADTYPATPIQLNWTIQNPQASTLLELSYTQVDLNGDVAERKVSYSIRDGRLEGLSDLCSLQADQLVCNAVPVSVNTPGQYTFTLTLITNNFGEQQRITQTLEPIEVRPPLPQILSFTVDGQDVQSAPQQIYQIDPTQEPTEITVAWSVANPEWMQVELLPNPGQLPANYQDFTHVLTPNPGTVGFTLQVTNAVGEQISRSVLIEKIVVAPEESLTELKPAPNSQSPENLPKPKAPSAPPLPVPTPLPPHKPFPDLPPLEEEQQLPVLPD